MFSVNKKYIIEKHELNGLKMKILVLPNEIAIECTNASLGLIANSSTNHNTLPRN